METQMTTETTHLTGRDAIEYARTHGLRLRKYADPTEGARDDLTVDEAEAVAREDASLVWIPADRYIAVQSMDAGTCEALRWSRTSIRPYIVATGRTAEQAYDRALEAGAPDDAVVYDTEEGCEVSW